MPEISAVLLLKKGDELFFLVREDFTVKLLVSLVSEVYGFVLLASEVSNHLWHFYFAAMASELSEERP